MFGNPERFVKSRRARLKTWFRASSSTSTTRRRRLRRTRHSLSSPGLTGRKRRWPRQRKRRTRTREEREGRRVGRGRVADALAPGNATKASDLQDLLLPDGGRSRSTPLKPGGGPPLGYGAQPRWGMRRSPVGVWGAAPVGGWGAALVGGWGRLRPHRNKCPETESNCRHEDFQNSADRQNSAVWGHVCLPLPRRCRRSLGLCLFCRVVPHLR